MEDKGKPFVIVDGDVEDKQIEEKLQNPQHYVELDESPLDEFNEKIEAFAAKGLASETITPEQYRFITNKQPSSQTSQEAEELHLANPQPKSKTHKVDDEGKMIEPVDIRLITVGTGTAIHRLSKLCSIAIEHLVKPEHLPRHNRSTKDVVKRIFLINDQHAPLPAES